jgi:hypothetical protein
MFHTDLGQLVIDGHRMLADHCKREGEDYSVVFGGDRDLEQIDWNKADLGAAVYRVKCWPTNLLPNTPAARANKLIEWMQAGLITAEQAMERSDHPDTDAMLGSYIYKRKNIEKKLAKLMEGEAFDKCMPHTYLDLKLAVTISSNQMNEFESKGYDEKSLDKLRTWFETAQKLLDAENAKQAALQGPPPGAAQPTNGAPPVAA